MAISTRPDSLPFQNTLQIPIWIYKVFINLSDHEKELSIGIVPFGHSAPNPNISLLRLFLYIYPQKPANLPSIPPYEEKTLLTRLAAAETDATDAFAALFAHYQPDINTFLLRFVKSPELAEDLAQEVFLKIWEHRQNLNEIQSFRAYLFITARNHTLTTLRKAARTQTAMGEITKHALANRDNSGDHILLKEYGQYLRDLLTTLPPRSREVFKLCREQNLSYDEVARQLGVSRNSVKNHMVLSMKILRAAVERDLGIPLSLLLLILYGS